MKLHGAKSVINNSKFQYILDKLKRLVLFSLWYNIKSLSEIAYTTNKMDV